MTADGETGMTSADIETPTGRPLLELTGLTVDFDGFRALDGVDLTVAEGELRFLIGPNGAGKTTLVDVVTGLTRATAGEVRFAGTSIARAREHRIVRMGIGRSFQTPTVFDSLTVAENLDLAESFRRPLVTLLRRARRVSDAVAATLDDIGLAAVATRPAGELSHGQKQWLEIGMLLVQDPKLLLLDEPVAGMSPQERLDTGALIQRLAGERTIVVIEHDMAFLRRFARTVTVLHEGKILCEGSVAEVQADPRVREVYLGRSRDERSGAIVVDPADVEAIEARALAADADADGDAVVGDRGAVAVGGGAVVGGGGDGGDAVGGDAVVGDGGDGGAVVGGGAGVGDGGDGGGAVGGGDNEGDGDVSSRSDRAEVAP